jgi:methylenetetrahydrofolate dehydrogenase (NADP+)/methenyltetrahydrofolate cyclohydrolase
MQLLDGKHVSQKIKEGLKKQVEKLVHQGQRPPHLAAVLVGNNGASETYVANKVKSCKEAGFQSTFIRLGENTTEPELIAVVEKLNADENIDGILVQLPLPASIDEYKIIDAISPNKDVDGFHPVNTGKMLLCDDDAFLPATPFGILLLLEHYNITTTGKRVVVLGRSNIVGRPISILMGQQRPYGNATVTLCHSQTPNIEEITLQADILISAIGKPASITASMVKEGAVVIDVGIIRVKDETSATGYKIKGDVDFETVAPKCSFITPVPGGVGPMTIAALMTNTIKAYSLSVQKP